MDESKKVRFLLAAIVEAVQAAGPTGAPSGPLYSALMGVMSLEQYDRIMASLVEAGLLNRNGFVYTVTPKGEAALPRLAAA